MGRIIPQVENNVKSKFSLMELVAFVERAMIDKGWNKRQLTKESGASSAAVTRFFQDGMINSENTFKILSALDLLMAPKQRGLCPVNCDLEMMQICKRVKELRDSRSHWWDSLEKNIDSFYTGLENDRGRMSGTPKPAGSTGLRKKVG